MSACCSVLSAGTERSSGGRWLHPKIVCASPANTNAVRSGGGQGNIDNISK